MQNATLPRAFSRVPCVGANQHDDYSVRTTSGSRGEQAMTLAIDAIELASSMTIVGLNKL